MIKFHDWDWVTQQLVIPCDGTMRDQILSVDTWQMLEHFPEAYWVSEDENNFPPLRMEHGVLVFVTGKLAFDLRNLTTLRDWQWSTDNNPPQDITHDLWLMDVEGKPGLVTFWLRGKPQLHFRLVY